MCSCTSVTMGTLNTNFVGGKGVAALYHNCSTEYVGSTTACSSLHIPLPCASSPLGHSGEQNMTFY